MRRRIRTRFEALDVDLLGVQEEGLAEEGLGRTRLVHHGRRRRRARARISASSLRAWRADSRCLMADLEFAACPYGIARSSAKGQPRWRPPRRSRWKEKTSGRRKKRIGERRTRRRRSLRRGASGNRTNDFHWDRRIFAPFKLVLHALGAEHAAQARIQRIFGRT